MSISVEQAYTQCRAIAKREAKNFYYSFVALPPHKSNAMCAVYA
ncbi:farnesyl-diphosphate farnesyltransferase, partial [Terriglobus sp. YAF25]